ncbi:hypothetical protein ATN84_04220 [Paramesorhizobium deserti]|uniref:Uncharacterized protein n=1 Tax=Paramesorhizobium deserti TaxID=1494590 RepID=A0A135I0J7_9HYPH|nr:hypothetical protein ATN84_04220 [Paramesorhizobium deserti]
MVITYLFLMAASRDKPENDDGIARFLLSVSVEFRQTLEQLRVASHQEGEGVATSQQPSS